MVSPPNLDALALGAGDCFGFVEVAPKPGMDARARSLAGPNQGLQKGPFTADFIPVPGPSAACDRSFPVRISGACGALPAAGPGAPHRHVIDHLKFSSYSRDRLLECLPNPHGHHLHGPHIQAEGGPRSRVCTEIVDNQLGMSPSLGSTLFVRSAYCPSWKGASVRWHQQAREDVTRHLTFPTAFSRKNRGCPQKVWSCRRSVP